MDRTYVEREDSEMDKTNNRIVSTRRQKKRRQAGYEKVGWYQA